MAAKIDHRTFLRSELDRRIVANPRYSLRAFAKSLGLDSGYLANVMTGKRYLSVGAAQKIADVLKLSDVEAQLLLESACQRAKTKKTGEGTQALVQKELDADTYAIISDMLHYLIIEATFLDGFKPDPRWIAARIGSTVIEVEAAMTRLIRLGLIERVNGTIRKTDRYLTTMDKTKTTPALKASQLQILKSAQRAIIRDPLEIRASMGGTMAIDPAKLPLAKQMIADFMDSLIEVLESGERKEVYQMSVSLFSLEKNLVL